MKMKFFILLIALNYVIKMTSSSPVVNSCGKKTSDEPNGENDCKDTDEPACKFVTVTINGETKKFCAIIHGKYNDKQVLEEVGQLIGGTVNVQGNGFMINLNYIIIFFFTILMFL